MKTEEIKYIYKIHCFPVITLNNLWGLCSLITAQDFCCLFTGRIKDYIVLQKYMVNSQYIHHSALYSALPQVTGVRRQRNSSPRFCLKNLLRRRNRTVCYTVHWPERLNVSQPSSINVLPVSEVVINLQFGAKITKGLGRKENNFGRPSLRFEFRGNLHGIRRRQHLFYGYSSF